MNLALDIGNTRLKMGVFDGARLVEKERWADWSHADLIAWANNAGIDQVIVSSVLERDLDLLESLQESFLVTELTHETALPFQNLYTTPKTLGKDRLAAVAGAQALFPGEHCLVIDCGTCIKYDLISADGKYHGGNIAPGAMMRIRAMHHFTARLPEVPLQMPVGFIGNSTETALQNGALLGAVLEIKGFVQLFENQFNPLKVICSGGDAVFFHQHLNLSQAIVETDLVLYGLNHILSFTNRPGN